MSRAGSRRHTVALLAEGVDRNADDKVIDALYCVALLAEGVDRNTLFGLNVKAIQAVALLAEGVDRNKNE